jgi:hypothetical protein
MLTHGLLSGDEKTIVQARPPGFRARYISRSPLLGLGKNIRPNRQIAASKTPSPTFKLSPSTADVSTLLYPAARALFLANSRITGGRDLAGVIRVTCPEPIVQRMSPFIERFQPPASPPGFMLSIPAHRACTTEERV